jgi:hypothetical protein
MLPATFFLLKRGFWLVIIMPDYGIIITREYGTGAEATTKHPVKL